MRLPERRGHPGEDQVERWYRAGYWRRELVGELLEQQAAQRPDGLAVVDADRRVTWQELYRLSRRLAAHLRSIGIGPGDAVAVQLPNWLEYLVSYYGIQLAGAVVVQPGIDWRTVELEHALQTGPVRAIIVPREFRVDFPAMIAALRPRLPHLEHVIVARGSAPAGCLSLDRLLEDPLETRSGQALRREERSSEDMTRIVFTSGTTGIPKPVVHTNNSVAFSVAALTSAFHFTAGDVVFMYVPFSTNYGAITGLHLPVTLGATVVLMDRFDPDRVLERIERERVTFIPGTPTAFLALLGSPELGRRDLGSLRLAFASGASGPPGLLQRVRDGLHTAAVEGYGMNEFGLAMWFTPQDDPAIVDGTIGRPIPGVEARVVRDDGQPAAVGEPGEMVIKSPGMSAGYLDSPEANAAAWDEQGWFHSGDLMTRDEHGNFRVVGRSKDIIIKGGANVSPREVEDALAGHPGVHEVSVVGLPDPYYGEVVCACVVPEPGAALTLEAVQEFLKPKIAFFKLPSHLLVCDALPRNSMGKVKKGILKQRAQQSTETDTVKEVSRRES
ncbi:MAG TPA: class I adenylate-forming enzyme family protein [Candidatus Limnocylindrales bacterium]|nr:class I adenylate-forming enzyme family protein [Candidatus Limnocylindrales bacterium]